MNVFKKKILKLPFGDSDVEHLAMAIYSCMHDSAYRPWTPYKKHTDEIVVETFRRYAYNIALSAYYEARDNRIACIYDWEPWRRHLDEE